MCSANSCREFKVDKKTTPFLEFKYRVGNDMTGDNMEAQHEKFCRRTSAIDNHAIAAIVAHILIESEQHALGRRRAGRGEHGP